MTWLVTGGAGYIGAHVVSAMCSEGLRVVVFDDASTGDRRRVAGVPFVKGSVLDQPLLERTMREHAVTGVVHTAGRKQVQESVLRPLYYYQENVEGLRRLLGAVAATGVGTFVFSSSAAVYGAPDVDLVREDTECRPVNPYGQTKLTGERMVADVARSTGMRYASLRYFNVAGAAKPELADAGQANLVPMVFQRLIQRQAPQIFGDDFPTPDGTCIRDFIHVCDIASAHLAAARALSEGRIHALVANVGRGEGLSVRDMITEIRDVTGTVGDDWARPVVAPRRAGDPPRVVASADVIQESLGWKAEFGLRDMVESAWAGWTARMGTSA
jgi:UDP-glucose 4-epimerase